MGLQKGNTHEMVGVAVGYVESGEGPSVEEALEPGY